MTPLSRSILTSSIWVEDYPTRLVWITLLAAMDRDGFVQAATTRNVAAMAGVTPAEAEAAMARFEAPDPSSSNPAHEGRRVARTAGGWRVLNAACYRQGQTRPRASRPAPTRPATPEDDAGFLAFWKAYPNKAARQNAKKAWARLQPDATLQARILEAVARYTTTETWRRDEGRFVPHAATFLNQRRFDDVDELAATPAATAADAERARTVALLAKRRLLLEPRQDGV